MLHAPHNSQVQQTMICSCGPQISIYYYMWELRWWHHRSYCLANCSFVALFLLIHQVHYWDLIPPFYYKISLQKSCARAVVGHNLMSPQNKFSAASPPHPAQAINHCPMTTHTTNEDGGGIYVRCLLEWVDVVTRSTHITWCSLLKDSLPLPRHPPLVALMPRVAVMDRRVESAHDNVQGGNL
jgi:hypothetical protein